jgi:hypothetical protein
VTAVSLLKREAAAIMLYTAPGSRSGLKCPLGFSESPTVYTPVNFFKAGTMGGVVIEIRNLCKMPGGSKLDLCH